MKIVIQRVKSAAIAINDIQYAEIKDGLLCFVGFCDTDNEDDFQWAIKKLINLKLFHGNQSLQHINGELLVVSQFTLFASIKKGNSPSWSRAAKPEVAQKMYNAFITLCHEHLSDKIKTGLFGADMQVELVNNGPITLIIDTKNKQ